MPPVPRFFVALSLLVLVLTHALALTAVRVRFEWRRAEIARTLCRNRLQPQLGCQGACVLREELKHASETTGGLLRLGANTLADLFLPASALRVELPTASPARAATAATWPRARAARPYDEFVGGYFRPPAALWS